MSLSCLILLLLSYLAIVDEFCVVITHLLKVFSREEDISSELIPGITDDQVF